MNAKELLENFVSQEWLTVKEVEKICPRCAQTMREEGIKKIRRWALNERMKNEKDSKRLVE